MHWQRTLGMFSIATLLTVAVGPSLVSGHECQSAFGRVQSASAGILRIITARFYRGGDERGCSPEIAEGTMMEFALTAESTIQATEGPRRLSVREIQNYKMAFVQFVNRGNGSVATYIQLSDKIAPSPPPEQIAEARQYYERGNEAAAQGGFADSAKWYTKAAELGNANAQERLGWQYANGKGVNGDYAKAMFWWSRAAEQGNADAGRELNDLRGRLAKDIMEHPIWPAVPNCQRGESLYSTRDGKVCVPGPALFGIAACITAYFVPGRDAATGRVVGRNDAAAYQTKLIGCQKRWLIDQGFHGPFSRLGP